MEDDWRKSRFMQGPSVEPVHWKKGSTIGEIIENYKNRPFEGRNVHAGARVLEEMIEKGDTIWLGISGAGIAGGMGGYVIDLIENGFVDVICSTGAQVYHDAHFAFGLPVVQGSPRTDDNKLRKDGTTRIYDIYIRENETLIPQDKIFREFARSLHGREISSADYNFEWGKYILEKAPHPEKSFVAAAAKAGVPVFWDSEGNHSIGMNNAALWAEGIDVNPSPRKSIYEAAAIGYSNPQMGFFEWGGGPKNWIQQISPMINQILKINFEGADRGLQITTAPEKDGGLSGCTLGEGVTWGKYKDAKSGVAQIWSEYSMIAPLLVGYALENCKPRNLKRLMDRKEEYVADLMKVAAEYSRK